MPIAERRLDLPSLGGCLVELLADAPPGTTPQLRRALRVPPAGQRVAGLARDVVVHEPGLTSTVPAQMQPGFVRCTVSATVDGKALLDRTTLGFAPNPSAVASMKCWLPIAAMWCAATVGAQTPGADADNFRRVFVDRLDFKLNLLDDQARRSERRCGSRLKVADATGQPTWTRGPASLFAGAGTPSAARTSKRRSQQQLMTVIVLTRSTR